MSQHTGWSVRYSAAAAVGFGLMAVALFLVSIALFLVSIAFWLALGLAFQFAQRLVVLENGNVAESLSTGFRMIRWHFKEVALGWLILMAVSIGVGIAVAILAIAVAIPGVARGLVHWGQNWRGWMTTMTSRS